MFASYSASYDWLLFAQLKHYHNGTQITATNLRMRKRLAAVLAEQQPSV